MKYFIFSLFVLCTTSCQGCAIVHVGEIKECTDLCANHKGLNDIFIDDKRTTCDCQDSRSFTILRSEVNK